MHELGISGGFGDLRSHQISAASDHPAFGVENASSLQFLDVRCKWSLLVSVRHVKITYKLLWRPVVELARQELGPWVLQFLLVVDGRSLGWLDVNKLLLDVVLQSDCSEWLLSILACQYLVLERNRLANVGVIQTSFVQGILLEFLIVYLGDGFTQRFRAIPLECIPVVVRLSHDLYFRLE